MSLPERGQVWYVTLDPVIGHEQAGFRPAIVVSVDEFNSGPMRRVVVVPLTKSDRRMPLNVRIEPPDGGLSVVSFAKPEDVRSVSVMRLGRYVGTLSGTTMGLLEDRLRVLLGL